MGGCNSSCSNNTEGLFKKPKGLPIEKHETYEDAENIGTLRQYQIEKNREETARGIQIKIYNNK